MNNKMERKNCLLLNFTVDGYHWGMGPWASPAIRVTILRP